MPPLGKDPSKMQPVKTVYRANDVVVSYHFLTLLPGDAMSGGLLPPVIDLIEGDDDEFSRGAGAMAGVGTALSFRSDYGPIGVELRFGALPEPGPDKSWSGIMSFDQPHVEVGVFDGPVFADEDLIPLPAGPGIYRAHIQWSYRPRPLPPEDLDVPYESWSQEDKKNPAREDFWEHITITLRSDPDAIVDAAPFQLPPADVVPATGGMPPVDELTWTDRAGAQRPILDVEMGSEEWLEQVAAGESGQPSIMGQGDRM